MFPEPSARAGGPWSKGLRPSRAIALEVVRFAFAVFLIATLVFAVFQIWAGPTPFLLSPHNPKYAGIAAVDREIFALDQPPWVRYGVWLGDVVTGNLGLSFYFREPVTQVVLRALPVTLELLFGSALWALLPGGLLGWGSAFGRHRILAGIFRESATVLYALPVFVAALGLELWNISAFRLNLGMPTSTAFPFGPPRVTGFPVLDSFLTGDLTLAGVTLATTALVALPAGLAFTLPIAHRIRKVLEAQRASSPPGSSRGVRNSMRATLRAVIPPVVGALGVLTPFLLGACMVAEIVTGRRGIGFLLIQSTYNLDGPLLQGVAVLGSLVALAIALPLSLVGAGLTSWKARVEAPGIADPVPGTSSIRHRSVREILHPSAGATIVLAVGLVLLAVTVGLTALAPWLAPYGPVQRVVPVGQICTPGVDCPLSPPTSQHWLGVDYFGFDIYSRVLWGGGYLMGAMAFALVVAAGLGVALGLLPSALGREADLVLRVGLGALAAIPIFLLALIVAGIAGLSATLVPLALGLLFVPIIFRDVRDLAAKAVDPGSVHGIASLVPGRMLGRVEAGFAAAVPGFLARLPRRAAEIALLLETLSFVGFGSGGTADWASEINTGLSFFVAPGGDPWPLYVPSILLILFLVGLLVLSDGLRLVLDPPSSTPGPRGVVLLPPLPGDANP